MDEQITLMRNVLHVAIEEQPMLSDGVIRISQELDKLIMEYYKTTPLFLQLVDNPSVN